MELLQSLRITTTPAWVRVLCGVIILASFVFNLYLGYQGLAEGKLHRLEATAYLLGIVLPIFIIALLVLGSRSGESALQKRTRDALVKEIPTYLSQIPDAMPPFQSKPLRCKNKGEKRVFAQVSHNYPGSGCFCDYRILVPEKKKTLKSKTYRIYIRVELNVKRANVNICIRDERVLRSMASEITDIEAFVKNNLNRDLDTQKYINLLHALKNRAASIEPDKISVDQFLYENVPELKGAHDLDELINDEYFQEIRAGFNSLASAHLGNKFKHSFGGASACPTSSETSAVATEYSYSFNQQLITRRVRDVSFGPPESQKEFSDASATGERDFFCKVGSASLARDFLWNPSERMFFAQDLMFMLRACLEEEPSLFERVD
jgi:hypothetical protein